MLTGGDVRAFYVALGIERRRLRTTRPCGASPIQTRTRTAIVIRRARSAS
jgi:hypothetical protein